MIISASYKTDLPAFYGRWFLRRLAAGYCKTVNPYSRQISTISLRREEVDGFVFWTKNPRPFLPALQKVHAQGYPFYVSFGVNGYPRAIEAAVLPAAKAILTFRKIADLYGTQAVVWRYDPILLTTLTDLDFQRRNFAALAAELSGATNEVVVSFAQMYQKTTHNLSRIGQQHDYTTLKVSEAERQELIADLAGIARTKGLTLTVCAQREYLGFGRQDAHCIDSTRLSKIAGVVIKAKGKGHRTDCGCAPARDIGEYDTCPHGCAYCYAVRRREFAKTRYLAHDSESEFLFAPS